MRITINTVKLVKEVSMNYEVSNDIIKSTESAAILINEIFDLENETKESFVALFFNTKNKLVGLSKLTTGTANASLASPRELLQMALQHNAVAVMIAHNHPSGDTSPSQEDIQVTKKIAVACNYLDIKLLDHIIIGEYGSYLSLKSEGYF